jgi:hypothetical protein
MEQAPQRHRDPQRARRVELGVLWTVALLGAAVIAGDVFIADTAEAFVRRLGETAWAWPLAAAVVISVLTSQPARRRWPRPAQRIRLGLVMVAGLWGLIAGLGPRATLLAGGLVAVVGLLVAWVVVLPRRLAPPLPTEALEPLNARDRLALTDARLKLQNDLRTTALQAIGGLAVLAGAVLAFQQLTADRQQATATQELTRQGQASERFTRAIDQLTSDQPEVRLGGIYGLEQIAQQAPDNRLAVAEVLVAFLHRSSTRGAATPTGQPVDATARPGEPLLRVRAPEVQAALTVLVRRRPLVTDPHWTCATWTSAGRISAARPSWSTTALASRKETFALRTCAALIFAARASSGCTLRGQTSALQTCAAWTSNACILRETMPPVTCTRGRWRP